MKSDYKIPKGQTEGETLDDVFKNGNEIEMSANDSLYVKDSQGNVILRVRNNNDKPSLLLQLSGDSILVDPQLGVKASQSFDTSQPFDFVQRKDLDEIHNDTYQVVVASGGHDVSQVQSNDITVIFSDTTDEIATLTIPAADASNEGKTITILSYSTKKNLSESRIRKNGISTNGGIQNGVAVKIKSIENKWYEIL